MVTEDRWIVLCFHQRVSPVWQGGEGEFIYVWNVSVYIFTHRGLVLFLGSPWGRINDNHLVIHLWALGRTTTILRWHIRPWECSDNTRFFLRQSLTNLIKTLLNLLIRQIDIEIKQHLYCDIWKSRTHFCVNDSLGLAHSPDRRTLRADFKQTNRDFLE